MTQQPRHRLVVIPRAHIGKYRDMSFAELEQAAERGDDGLRFSDSSNYGEAYYRAGDPGGMLEGRPSLYFQGWV